MTAQQPVKLSDTTMTQSDTIFLCLVLIEPKAPCYRAYVCVRNSAFSRVLRQQPETNEQCSFDFRIPRRHEVQPTTRDHFRAIFV